MNIRDTITKRDSKDNTHTILSYNQFEHKFTLTINRSTWNIPIICPLHHKFERDAIRWYNDHLYFLTNSNI